MGTGRLKRVIVEKRKSLSGVANYRPSSSRSQQPLSGHSSAEERGVQGPVKACILGLQKVSWRSVGLLRLLVPYVFLHIQGAQALPPSTASPEVLEAIKDGSPALSFYACLDSASPSVKCGCRPVLIC